MTVFNTGRKEFSSPQFGEWFYIFFCPTYGVHDFRVSMEVYHMPTVLLNYQIKKKLPHKSPHLAQIFWVCPEIRVFLSLQTFARSLSCLVTMCMPLRSQLKINQFLLPSMFVPIPTTNFRHESVCRKGAGAFHSAGQSKEG